MTRDVKNGIEIIPIRPRQPRALHVVLPPGVDRAHLAGRIYDLLQDTKWSDYPNTYPEDDPHDDFTISESWQRYDNENPKDKTVPYGSWIVVDENRKVKIVPDWEFSQQYEVDI